MPKPKVIHSEHNRGLLYIICSVLAVIILGLCPSSSGAHADNVDFSVTIAPSLNVTIPTDVVSLNLNPANSAFSSQDLTVSVGTNNITGYTLTMTANSTDLTRTEAVGSTTPTISTLANEVAENEFTANRWGYRFSDNTTNTNYQPFATSIPFNESDSAVNNDARTITFGAKVNTEQAPGTYELALVFTAVAKAPMPHIQNYDGTLCTSAPSLVYDVRDGNAYAVQRLADGKCWMTSNLNLVGGTRLESTNSDVPAGYTLYNPYYTLPDSETITSGTSLPSTAFSDDSTAYVFNTGNITTNQSDCTASSSCNSYYSWLAATAGGKDSSGNAVTSDGYNAAYSICPKGWKLPTSTTSNANAQTSPNWKTGDWYALATAYGTNLASNYYDNSDATGANFYNQAGPGTMPNFLLAGYYDFGSFSVGGSNGYYWSSTSVSSTFAYSLGFGSDIVYSAHGSSRRAGFPVRCVLDEPPTMQEQTADTLAALLPNEGDSTTLRDARDNQTYTVANINGNYWMTQNLRFDISTYSMNTDTSNMTWNARPNSTTWAGTYTEPKIYKRGDTATSSDRQTYGIHYNYCAASAGTNCQSSSTASQSTTQNICPKGWSLPTQAQISSIGTSSNTYVSAFAPVIGHVTNAGLQPGYNSYWWSATANSAINQYDLHYDYTNLNTTYSDKRLGAYVRCVLDTTTISDYTYMQDVSAAAVNNTTNGATATLTDKRDNETYTVAKINGSLWMTQNLRFVGTSLDSVTSNVAITYTDASPYLINSNMNVSPAAWKSLASDSVCKGSSNTADNTSYQCMQSGTDNNGNPTVWYNYASATAGTITGASNSTAASYDICPKGWHLPANGTSSGQIGSVTSYRDAFSPVYGGYYGNGSLDDASTYGYWWSATANDTAHSYYLAYTSSVLSTYYSLRRSGLYVRCVRT